MLYRVRNMFFNNGFIRLQRLEGFGEELDIVTTPSVVFYAKMESKFNESYMGNQ